MSNEPRPQVAVAERPEPAPLAVRLPVVNEHRNKYLSVSRIKRYEQCPKAFRFSYVDKRPRGDSEPAEFGTVLHAALEGIFDWIVREEYVGKVPEELILAHWQQRFKDSQLSDVTFYRSGLDLLTQFFEQREPHADHRLILAVEQEFTFEHNGTKWFGYIDRVDKIDDESIHIRDYKSNRMLFTREEVDHDLQMSVYARAAQIAYPWAKRMVFSFEMLRHGFAMTTERENDFVEDSLDYATLIGQRTELREQQFPAKLNTLCGWCDHRSVCEEYQEAISNEGQFDDASTPEGLDEISQQRERVHAIVKLAEGRKRELEKALKVAVDKSPDSEIEVNGHRYKFSTWAQRSYPVKRTIETLCQMTKCSEDSAREAILKVDGKALDEFVKKLSLPKGTKTMLDTALASVAIEGKQQRFDGRAISKVKKKTSKKKTSKK